MELINAMPTDDELHGVDSYFPDTVTPAQHDETSDIKLHYSSNAKHEGSKKKSFKQESVGAENGENAMSRTTSALDSFKTNSTLNRGMEKEKQPKVVLVSFKINHVTEIDVVSCNFHVSCSLFYHWEDPSLIGHPLGKIKKADLGPESDAEIIVVNDLTLEETSRAEVVEVINSATGAVKMSKHVKGRVFLMSLDLQMFPFDVQNLSINLRSKRQDITDTVLEYFSEESTVDAHPQHEWIFHGYSALTYTTLPHYSTTGKIYSSLHIVVLVQRHSGWFINNVFLVSFVLTLVSWTAYALPIAQLHPGQYDITLLTLLASITNKYVIGDKLPKVPYRTVVDGYIDISFFCQIFGVLSAVLRDWVVDHGDSVHRRLGEETGWLRVAPHLNTLLFFTNVGVFAIYHLWLFFKLKNHVADVSVWKSKALALNNIYDSNCVEEKGDNLGLSGMESSNLDDINRSSLSAYQDLGFFGSTPRRSDNVIEHFGNNSPRKGMQAVLMEDEEVELVSIMSNKLSPTNASTMQEKYKHIYQPAYINKLNAFQRALALRADLGCRLAKYGLTADYCRPDLDKLLEQTRRRSYAGTPDGGASTEESVPHHVQDRVGGSASGAPQGRPSLGGGNGTGRKNTVLDFEADGYVKSAY